LTPPVRAVLDIQALQVAGYADRGIGRYVAAHSVALELAACGLLDPATSLLLAGAAHDARAAGEPTELAESDLTRALRAVLSQPDFRASLDGGPGAEEILAELEATKVPERAGRALDHETEDAFERLRVAGYL